MINRIIKGALQIAAIAVLFVATDALAAASQTDSVPTSAATPSSTLSSTYLGDYQQVAQVGAEQSAALPVGTIRLRVIPRIGGATVADPINWRITTFGRDSAGVRKTVAEVTGSTPELVLPAGWYVVHARLADKTIMHPVEVTAGRTFKYTLVKN